MTRSDLVQIRNPRTDRWVKIDRSKGVIVSTKTAPGPYKNVRQIYAKKPDDPA